MDGRVHTESFTPALVKGPAATRADKPGSLPPLLPAHPEGHGFLVSRHLLST